jgi:hypothetical protein
VNGETHRRQDGLVVTVHEGWLQVEWADRADDWVFRFTPSATFDARAWAESAVIGYGNRKVDGKRSDGAPQAQATENARSARTGPRHRDR